MKKIILITVISIFLISTGVKILAQDSQTSSVGLMPDSPFYFLKVVKEKIQTFFTFSAENKTKQYLHLAEVRMAEYQKMLEKGKTELARKTLEKYEKQLNKAIVKIEELKSKGKNVEDTSQKIEESVAKHINILERNLQKAPESAKKGLDNALESARKLIQKKTEKNQELECIKSGGEIKTSFCCLSTGDFPNLCLIGACGCASENSKEVKICDCGENNCFNGIECVPLGPKEQIMEE